jgi:hypothetical protein
VSPPSAGDLRRPLFVAAIVVSAVVILAELGLSGLVGGNPVGLVPIDVATSVGVDADVATEVSLGATAPPGNGISYLALVDGLLLFTLALLGSSMVISQRAYGRAQGIVTLVVTFFWILAGLLTALLALAQLLLMVGLFVAVPFGTLAYLAIWGFFPTGEAALVLGLLLALKIALVALLIAAQQRFLQIKGLMLLIVVSVVLQLILGLIHGFLPGPVVAIGDQLWALVTAVVGIIWALVMLIGSIPAVVNAVRVSGAVAD